MVNYLFYPLIVATLLWVAAFAYFFFSQQKDKESLQAKNLLIIATVLFLLTLFVCVPLHLRNQYNAQEFFVQPLYFYPMLASIIALILGIGFYLFAKLNNKFTFVAKWVLTGVVSAAVIVVFIFLTVYYNREIAPLEDYESVNSLWLFIGAGLIVAVLAVLSALFGKKSNSKTETRSVTFAAVSVALAFALSYIRLFRLPQGGSITLVSLLPLMLYSQMFGVRKGVVVGVVFGLLSAIQDPWILHPAQFLLDYPLAFGCIGLSAIFTQEGIKGKKGIALFACGSVLAVTLRYLSHVLSGIFAFSMYAQPGYGAVAWGFLYNTFAFADMAIALAVGVLMLFNSSFLRIVNRVTLSGLSIAPQNATAISEEVSVNIENVSSDEENKEINEDPSDEKK